VGVYCTYDLHGQQVTFLKQSVWLRYCGLTIQSVFPLFHLPLPVLPILKADFEIVCRCW